MRVLAILWTAVVLVMPLSARATDVYGDQWGTWTRDNSPFNVIGEIRVPPESTLVIEAGVLVNFQGHYKFIVDSLARVEAIGSEADSIYFTAEDSAIGWHGIRFLYADRNSQVTYCRLEYGKASGDGEDARGGAIYCSNSSPRISSNTFRGNIAEMYGGAISCWNSSPIIINNTITGNQSWSNGGGISCDYSNPIIGSNTISSNSATQLTVSVAAEFIAATDPVPQ
jgi:hypothetical protein